MPGASALRIATETCHTYGTLAAAVVLGMVCAITSAPAISAPMSFSLMTASGVEGCGKKCRIVVAASGEIEKTSASRFERLVRENFRARPRGLTVLLASQGGYVIAAAKLGEVFRKHKVTVVVASVGSTNRNNLQIRMQAARCVSACVYALMGGYRRVLPRGSNIILHRSYAGGSFLRAREYGNDVLRQYILGYAKSMGVSQDVIKFAERLHPSRLYQVNDAQIKRWKLAKPYF